MKGYCSKGEDKRGLGFWGSGCRDYRLRDFSAGGGRVQGAGFRV